MRYVIASGARRAAVVLVVTLVVTGGAVCATHPRGPSPPDPPWRAVATARPLAVSPDLCEERWESVQPPGGPYSRVGLRRLTPCPGHAPAGDAVTPVHPLLFLPGTHMNGTVTATAEAHDFRLYLARRGVTVWSLDYRTHFVPPDTADLEFMRAWTGDVFLDDVAAAFAAVRRAHAGMGVVVTGFSRGASLAYALAAREPPGLAGLAILDGVAPGGLPHAQRPAEPPPAIDVASRRLPWPARQALLAAVMTTPDGASGDPAFASAGERLAHILYTSAAFGGRGGLSDSLHGCADIAALARLLASYDRYWPTAAAPEAGTATGAVSTRPVFVAVSGNMGPHFRHAVEASARAVGGEATTVVSFSACGHLDVLVGRSAPAVIFAPLWEWLRTLP